MLLYGWLFFEVKLYSDMLLQLVYALLQGYGWWRWSRGQVVAGKVRVERLTPGSLRNGLLAGAIGGAALGFTMHRLADAACPGWTRCWPPIASLPASGLRASRSPPGGCGSCSMQVLKR